MVSTTVPPVVRPRARSIGQRVRRPGLVLTLGAALALVGQLHAEAIPADAPAVGMVCTDGTLSGSTRTFNLVAKSGDIETPDGNAVFMWSYANADAPDNGSFQSPGPVLCATQGETIRVNLTNTLSEPTSIVFPGQDSEVTGNGTPGLLTSEAPAASPSDNGSASYTFTASQPGTYIYESGSDVAKQIEMGLYGALVIRPNTTTCPAAAAPCAYDDTTQYDRSREFILLLADIDPELHHAVKTGANYDFDAQRDRYFTINGRSFPDTIMDNGSALLPTQPYGAMVRIQPTGPDGRPALIRLLNVGLSNHPFHPHGNHTIQIAQDGRQVARTEHFGETIGSGQTEDFLLKWDDQTNHDNWNPNTNPLPVAQPNYRNLTFKDGNTFYAGSPYLGYKGTLPSGTTQQNVCGEWYFPWHSHALNEFTNFDEGFGGMGTLLRVDPSGGCFAAPSSTVLPGGVVKSGSVTALAAADATYFQVNPKTTTRPNSTNATQTTITVASAAGFPTSGQYYVRIDNEVMQVTAGAGSTTWTVARHQLGTSAATHATGAVVTALANDWYAGFTSVPAGATNLKVTYGGKNCATTTGTTCTALSTNLPQQTVKICNWTIAGAAGCSTATSAGWVTLPAPPAQPQGVGSSEISSTWTTNGPSADYIGTGANAGQVRVLVHTERWTAPSPTAFATWGNFMQVVYDAP
ncbi:MAG: multicopper oxidase domain-containing protein [Nocardioides sp.]|nr:multicopper oxidase domain-containing protein [Nocardioides sp.]